jgi:hypothetical protein
MTAIDAALAGLHSAEALLDHSARQIASLPSTLTGSRDMAASVPAPDVVDLSAAMVALLEARNQHALNIRVLETALDIEAHLIDVLA